MGFLSEISRYITVVHINALISIQYFFINSIWFLVGGIGWSSLLYFKLKDIEKRYIKPKRKRL
jgi:hypothetical protein